MVNIILITTQLEKHGAVVKFQILDSWIPDPSSTVCIHAEQLWEGAALDLASI